MRGRSITKINLVRHKIKETESVSLKEIPLAYIDTDQVERSVHTEVEPDFAVNKSYQIRPYDEFDTSDLYLFDDEDHIISDLPLKRIGTKYYYEPAGSTEFSPVNFSCYAEIRRRMKFDNKTPYNIRVGVHETDSMNPTEFSDQLITIFADAYTRGLCPANIRINNGAMDAYSLTNREEVKCDFLFMKSKDGYHVGDSKTAIDIDTYMNNHVNLWLSVDDFQGMFQTLYTADVSTMDMPEPMLYTDKKYSLSYTAQYKVFDRERTNPDYPLLDYDYIYINSRILVLRKQGKGYIIVTNKDFLEYSKENVKLIYETLMKVYLNGYYKSREELNWITDEPVDYQAGQKKKLGIRQGKVNLPDLLTNPYLDIGEDYQLLSIRTSDKNVLFVGLDTDMNLLFKKIGGNKDPQKPLDAVSYMTSKGTVIYYKESEIYYKEEPISIIPYVNGPEIYVTVRSYLNSRLKIQTQEDQTIRLPDNYHDYYLCVSPSNKEVENSFHVVQTDAYDEEKDGQKAAFLSVVMDSAVNVSDIRPMGGGLPADQPDDYDLMDIGHLKGRPYRLGGTLVIRLPSKLKPYEERIQSEVKKHMAAGEYPLFVFDR